MIAFTFVGRGHSFEATTRTYLNHLCLFALFSCDMPRQLTKYFSQRKLLSYQSTSSHEHSDALDSLFSEPCQIAKCFCLFLCPLLVYKERTNKQDPVVSCHGHGQPLVRLCQQTSWPNNMEDHTLPLPLVCSGNCAQVMHQMLHKKLRRTNKFLSRHFLPTLQHRCHCRRHYEQHVAALDDMTGQSPIPSPLYTSSRAAKREERGSFCRPGLQFSGPLRSVCQT